MPKWGTDAIAWGVAKQKATQGVAITYSRTGVGSVSLTAIPGNTRTEMVTDEGFSLPATPQDFLILALELELDSVQVEPERGDAIELSDGTVFHVVPRDGETCFRWSDNHRTVYRVHVTEGS